MVRDVSRHPVGINLDFFMDGDLDLKRSRHITEALRAMGVKYLRYPGGDKSDLNLFSVPPYDKSKPTLARTGKGAVDDYVKILKDYNDFKYDVLDFAAETHSLYWNMNEWLGPYDPKKIDDGVHVNAAYGKLIAAEIVKHLVKVNN